MEKNKIDFKKYITNDNKSGYKTKKNHIIKNFPLLYNEILLYSEKNNLINIPFLEQLYTFLNNMTSIPLCPVCNKQLLFKKSFNEGYNKFCSIKCCNSSDEHITKIKKGNVVKFGGVSPIHSKTIKEKIKKTNLSLYGVDNIFKNIEYIKDCVKLKYNVEHISQLDSVKEKKKKTNIKTYGVSTPILLKSSRKSFIEHASDRFKKKIFTFG